MSTLELRRISRFSLLILALLAGGQAWATDDAEALVKEGLRLRRSGDDEHALPLFERAYLSRRGARTAAQLGLCEQALGHWAQADEHLTEAVTATEDPWIKKNRQVLEEALSTIRKHVARIEVAGGPAGATVEVAGRPAGKLPLAGAIRVPDGYVEVRVSAPGHKTTNKSFTTTGGQYLRVTIDLEKDAPTVAPGSVPATGVAAPNSENGVDPADDSNRTKRRIGIGAGVTGILVTGIGLGLLFRSHAQLDSIEKAAREMRAFDEKDKGWEATQKVGVVVTGIGVAALASGVWIYLAGRDKDTEQHAHLAPWLMSHGTGLALRGTLP